MASRRGVLDGGGIRRDPMGLLEMGFALFGTMFMTGGLLRILDTRSLAEMANTQSVVVQMVGALIYLACGILIGLRHRAFMPLLARSAVVLLPVLLAFASMQWSVGPDTTFRRSIALLGTVLFGLYLGARFRPSELALILFLAMSGMTVGSFLSAILTPRFGVHQATDGVQEHHAGLWRGLYPHKNQLGTVASVCMLVTLAFWRLIPVPGAAKALVVVVAVATVLMTGSATGLLLAVLFSSGVVFHRSLVALPPLIRLAVATVGGGIALFGIVYSDEIFSFALTALGRSPDMSGRTEIWTAAFITGQQRPLLGGGYSVGWNAGAGLLTLQMTGVDPGHAHNGYIQTWLDVGFVGFVFVAPVWITYVSRMLRMPAVNYPFYLFSLYLFLTYLTNNLSHSDLVRPQSTYMLFIVALIVMNDRLLLAARPTAARPTAALRAAPA